MGWPEQSQNKYQVDDFALFQRDSNVPKPTLLSSPYAAPWSHTARKNVKCRHMVMENIMVFRVTRLNFSSRVQEKKTRRWPICRFKTHRATYVRETSQKELNSLTWYICVHSVKPICDRILGPDTCLEVSSRHPWTLIVQIWTFSFTLITFLIFNSVWARA